MDPDADIRFNVEADRATWLFIDVDADGAEWASATAQRVWVETTRTPTGDQLASVANQLMVVHAQAVAMELPLINAYYPSLDQPPHPIVTLSVWDLTDGSQEALAAAGGAQDPNNVEPASQVWIETPLGPALRVARFVPTAGDPKVLTRLVVYLWHLPALGATLGIMAGSSWLERMAACADALDDYARAVRIIGLG